MASNEMCYCEKCNRTMGGDQFYGSNNLEKYPDGKLKTCKKCTTMHVDNFNPDTYLWILQECDVPFIMEEWNKLMASYGKDKSKMTGLTIVGRYLSKMKLKQYKDFRWKDNDFLQELANSKIETTMKRQGYDAATIASAIDRASITIPEGELAEFVAPVFEEPHQFEAFGAAPIDDGFDDDLTEEDRTYLRLKWGKTYRPEEWIQLEQLYEEMMASYDITAAGDVNTLKLACKCSLKANQLLDLGDMEGAQKATKMYDGLMKSGKWTAQQNKTDDNELVDSIGELVAICEREGFIPKYYTASPQDHVDRVIEDLKRYTHDLIDNETGLNSMIEVAVQQIEDEKNRIEAAANAEEIDEEDKMFDYDNLDAVLSNEDFVDFSEFQEQLSGEDAAFYQQIMAGEDDD